MGLLMKMADVRYRDLENALVAIFRVPEEGLGAFRARIRHLRNIGVPKLEKVGSGTQLIYTRKQALEMVLAIELELSGISPRLVAPLAKFGAEKFFELRGRQESVYMIVSRQLSFDAPEKKTRRGEQKTVRLKAPEGIVGIFIVPSVAGTSTSASVTVGTENYLNQIRNSGARHLSMINLSMCNSSLPDRWK
jgi:hypothetical protein